ncbi:MAG: rhomboid family intramembrane serine protease [Muribaculum sp.]|nr:rhomboid family intramembrane serine protease [Muribaculum sp.]
MLKRLTPVTRNIIIICAIIWIAGFFSRTLSDAILSKLGLCFVESSTFIPWQPVTYMFVHAQDNFFHIFFNMFTLFMFGPILEHTWGSKRFLLYYFICGIGAAITQECVWALSWQHDYVEGIAKLNGLTFDHMKQIMDAAVAAGDSQWLAAIDSFKAQMITVGASGAIFGILLGFAFVFPNMPLYLFFIPIPIKAKYMVMGYAVIELVFGIGGSLSSIAHFAHLGGMLFALIPLLIWKRNGTLRGNGFYY